MHSCRQLAALVLVVMTACGDDPAPGAADATGLESAGNSGVSIEWLDDPNKATGASMHRMAAQIQAPRGDEAAVRRVARDALVARALELGFVRLDDLQIETSCDDAAPEATACSARVMAIASR